MDATFYTSIAMIVVAAALLFKPGSARTERAAIGSWSRFVFGPGLWRIWHALLVASVVVFGVGLALAAAETADEIGIAMIVLFLALGSPRGTTLWI